MSQVKVVVVGDGTVGKTCLLHSYAHNTFPEEYLPTVFDNIDTDVMLMNQRFRLHICDTAGQADYDRLRPLSYPLTDVFIICFSISSRSSFENITDKWHPEIKHYVPNAPFILIGTKLDLRSSKPGDCRVSTREGMELASRIGAFKYIECSALTQERLKDVFDEAVLASQKKPPPKKFCCIL